MKKYRFYRPFWQKHKPYLEARPITDIRFRALGQLMALLAGAINAGGFFAVSSYTSHVTGAISRTADHLFDKEWGLAAIALSGVVCFILGAAHANWTVIWLKRHRFRSSYGLALWLEAAYLLLFELFLYGTHNWEVLLAPPTMLILCWIMGMHNAVMTILSGAAIRATHMTGTATDLGIELSKALYYEKRKDDRLPDANVNRVKMRLLCGMILAFLLGGIIGTWGFHKVGHHFTMPVAIMLFLIGMHSIGHDVRVRIKRRIRQKRKQYFGE